MTNQLLFFSSFRVSKTSINKSVPLQKNENAYAMHATENGMFWMLLEIWSKLSPNSNRIWSQILANSPLNLFFVYFLLFISFNLIEMDEFISRVFFSLSFEEHWTWVIIHMLLHTVPLLVYSYFFSFLFAFIILFWYSKNGWGNRIKRTSYTYNVEIRVWHHKSERHIIYRICCWCCCCCCCCSTLDIYLAKSCNT